MEIKLCRGCGAGPRTWWRSMAAPHSSLDVRFAHARATQPQVFSIVRDRDIAGNSPRGTTGDGGHWEMAHDSGRLVPIFSGEFQGLEAVGMWPKRCSVTSSSPTRGCRGPKRRRVVARWAERKLGFDLNLWGIRAWGGSIYRDFWSPVCAARIWSRPYPKLEFKLTFGSNSEENPRWGNFSFGSFGEDSRRATTRLVGSRWVDFG
jgi:hypothetical protein